MDTTPQNLVALLRETLLNPMDAARQVKHMGLPREALWQALALIIVVGVLVGEMSSGLIMAAPEAEPAQVPPFMLMMQENPILGALGQVFLLVVSVFAVHRIGVEFGGTGSFDETLHLVVWFEAVMLVLRVGMLFTLVLSAPLGVMVGFVLVIVHFWLASGFIMELHGFTSRGKVLFGIVVATIALAIALMIILAILGVQLVPQELADV